MYCDAAPERPPGPVLQCGRNGRIVEEDFRVHERIFDIGVGVTMGRHDRRTPIGVVAEHAESAATKRHHPAESLQGDAFEARDPGQQLAYWQGAISPHPPAASTMPEHVRETTTDAKLLIRQPAPPGNGTAGSRPTRRKASAKSIPAMLSYCKE